MKLNIPKEEADKLDDDLRLFGNCFIAVDKERNGTRVHPKDVTFKIRLAEPPDE